MKRIISNPDYVNGKYELGFITQSGAKLDYSQPHRFNSVPPSEVWETGRRDSLNEWIMKHSIPPFIEVEDKEV